MLLKSRPLSASSSISPITALFGEKIRNKILLTAIKIHLQVTLNVATKIRRTLDSMVWPWGIKKLFIKPTKNPQG